MNFSQDDSLGQKSLDFLMSLGKKSLEKKYYDLEFYLSFLSLTQNDDLYRLAKDLIKKYITVESSFSKLWTYLELLLTSKIKTMEQLGYELSEEWLQAHAKKENHEDPYKGYFHEQQVFALLLHTDQYREESYEKLTSILNQCVNPPYIYRISDLVNYIRPFLHVKTNNKKVKETGLNYVRTVLSSSLLERHKNSFLGALRKDENVDQKFLIKNGLIEQNTESKASLPYISPYENSDVDVRFFFEKIFLILSEPEQFHPYMTQMYFEKWQYPLHKNTIEEIIQHIFLLSEENQTKVLKFLIEELKDLSRKYFTTTRAHDPSLSQNQRVWRQILSPILRAYPDNPILKEAVQVFKMECLVPLYPDNIFNLPILLMNSSDQEVRNTTMTYLQKQMQDQQNDEYEELDQIIFIYWEPLLTSSITELEELGNTSIQTWLHDNPKHIDRWKAFGLLCNVERFKKENFHLLKENLPKNYTSFIPWVLKNIQDEEVRSYIIEEYIFNSERRHISNRIDALLDAFFREQSLDTQHKNMPHWNRFMRPLSEGDKIEVAGYLENFPLLREDPLITGHYPQRFLSKNFIKPIESRLFSLQNWLDTADKFIDIFQKNTFEINTWDQVCLYRLTSLCNATDSLDSTDTTPHHAKFFELIAAAAMHIQDIKICRRLARLVYSANNSMTHSNVDAGPFLALYIKSWLDPQPSINSIFVIETIKEIIFSINTRDQQSHQVLHFILKEVLKDRPMNPQATVMALNYLLHYSEQDRDAGIAKIKKIASTFSLEEWRLLFQEDNRRPTSLISSILPEELNHQFAASLYDQFMPIIRRIIELEEQIKLKISTREDFIKRENLLQEKKDEERKLPANNVLEVLLDSSFLQKNGYRKQMGELIISLLSHPSISQWTKRKRVNLAFNAFNYTEISLQDKSYALQEMKNIMTDIRLPLSERNYCYSLYLYQLKGKKIGFFTAFMNIFGEMLSFELNITGGQALIENVHDKVVLKYTNFLLSRLLEDEIQERRTLTLKQNEDMLNDLLHIIDHSPSDVKILMEAASPAYVEKVKERIRIMRAALKEDPTLDGSQWYRSNPDEIVILDHSGKPITQGRALQLGYDALKKHPIESEVYKDSLIALIQILEAHDVMSACTTGALGGLIRSARPTYPDCGSMNDEPFNEDLLMRRLQQLKSFLIHTLDRWRSDPQQTVIFPASLSAEQYPMLTPTFIDLLTKENHILNNFFNVVNTLGSDWKSILSLLRDKPLHQVFKDPKSNAEMIVVQDLNTLLIIPAIHAFIYGQYKPFLIDRSLDIVTYLLTAKDLELVEGDYSISKKEMTESKI